MKAYLIHAFGSFFVVIYMKSTILCIVLYPHIVRIHGQYVHLGIKPILFLVVLKGTNLRQDFVRRSLKCTLIYDHNC